MHKTAVPECEGGEQNSGSHRHRPQKAVAASEYSETGGGAVRRQHRKARSRLRTDGSEPVRSHSGTEEVSGTGGAQVVHVPAPPRPGPHAPFFADVVLDLRLEGVTIQHAAATQKTMAKRRSGPTDGATGGGNHHRRGTRKTTDPIDRHGTHIAPSSAANSNSRTGHKPPNALGRVAHLRVRYAPPEMTGGAGSRPEDTSAPTCDQKSKIASQIVHVPLAEGVGGRLRLSASQCPTSSLQATTEERADALRLLTGCL